MRHGAIYHNMLYRLSVKESRTNIRWQHYNQIWIHIFQRNVIRFRITGKVLLWVLNICFCNGNRHKIFSSLKMFISRTAMKLPFTWGIKQHKHFSKCFQRWVNTFKHICWGKHNKPKHKTLLFRFLRLNGAVLMQVFISYYSLKDHY